MAKLLLVEDDNNLREIYEARLQAEGYSIVAAKDGEEALVAAKAEKPDLIISDVMMPKISGFEMLDILRNTDGLKDVKVIMLTALGQSDDQQRGEHLGADKYLVKSQVTLEDIVKTAHELLGDAEPAPAETTPAAPVIPDPVPAATPPAPPPAAPVQPAMPAPAPPVTTAEPAATPIPTLSPTVVTEPASTVPAAPVQPEPQAIPEPSLASVIPPLEPELHDAPAVQPDSPATETTPSVDTQVAADAAQSTSQEEANVEAKIEDFIVGASSDPTPAELSVEPTGTSDESIAAPAIVVADPVPAPAEPSMPDAAVQPEPQAIPEPALPPIEAPVEASEADTAATEDSASPQQPAAAPVTQTPPAEPPHLDQTPQPDSEDAPSGEIKTAHSDPVEAPKEDLDQNIRVAGKKVIEPIPRDPQQDIQALLAVEEAKEAAKQGPPPPKVVMATNETGVTEAPLQPVPTDAPPQATEFAANKPQPAVVETPGSPPAPTNDPNNIAL